MKIINIDAYLDGGTIIIHTDDGCFCYDNRINSETKGYMFSGYPKDDKSNIMSTQMFRKYNFEIIQSLLHERIKSEKK